MNFQKTYFKTTERHTLTVCGLFWGEKQFLLIFIPFSWFAQKQLFHQILFFLWICPFKYGKKNKHFEYFKFRS